MIKEKFRKILFILLFLENLKNSDSRLVSIKSKANDAYISISNNLLLATNKNKNQLEKFELIENSDNTVSFTQPWNNYFVSVNPINNQLEVNKKPTLQFIKFIKILNKDGTYSLKFNLNSKYVSIDYLGDSSLLSNSFEITQWESFFIEAFTEQTTTQVIKTTASSTTSDDSNNKQDEFYPTFKEFSDAFTFNQYSVPTKEQYNNFKNDALLYGGISTKIELAMFLTQVMYQSDGLTNKIEKKCGSKCANCKYEYSYPADYLDKLYCGRGYIQITWSYNYKVVSLDLFKDSRLFNDPDQIETNDKIAWDIAFWYWKNKVTVNENVVKYHQFGASTKQINGDNECKGPNFDAAKSRFSKYVLTLKAFNINETPNESGCYNASPSPDNQFEKPSYEEFSNALLFNKYPKPTEEQYENCINGAALQGGINSKRELAMFLAQIIHESGGLKYKIEQRCGSGCQNCPWDYADPKDYPGQHYCGRGYMQLSWHYNYRDASKGLFKDDRLYKNPDLVETDDKISWGTAFWFWNKRVRINKKVRNGQFGSSTKQINGGLECGGANTQLAKIRFDKYKLTLKAFNIDEQPIEDGCY